MDKNITKLIDELKEAGATGKEAEELALLSKNFSNAVKIERSFETKVKFLKGVGLQKRFLSFKGRFAASFLALLLFVSFATVVSAQDSLPGQPLYPIKRLSEDVVVAINPSFKGEVLKRRSSEIKLLSETKDKKNSTNLKNTIKDYEGELNGKGNIGGKDIEDSKNNLEDASRVASDGSKLEIENVLRQTEEKQTDLHKENDSGEVKPVPTNIPVIKSGEEQIKVEGPRE